jgi:translation initiation factor 1A
MPKNKGAGGKKFKKIKHNLEAETKQVELAEEDQEYGLVTQLLGNGRTRITYIKDGIGHNVLGIICGRLRRKKKWVISGNIVIISLREFEREKVDIIHVYTEQDMNELKRKNVIDNKLLNITVGANFDENEDNGEFSEFIDYDKTDKENKNNEKKFRGNNITVQDFGIISSDSEDNET